MTPKTQYILLSLITMLHIRILDSFPNCILYLFFNISLSLSYVNHYPILLCDSICRWYHVEFVFMCLVYLIWHDILHEGSHFWKWQDFLIFEVAWHPVVHIGHILFIMFLLPWFFIFVLGNSLTVKVQMQTLILSKFYFHFL